MRPSEAATDRGSGGGVDHRARIVSLGLGQTKHLFTGELANDFTCGAVQGLVDKGPPRGTFFDNQPILCGRFSVVARLGAGQLVSDGRGCDWNGRDETQFGICFHDSLSRTSDRLP